MHASAILTSLPLAFVLLAPVHAQEVRIGAEAFGTWERDAPGVSRHIRPTDLPPPSHLQNDPEAPDFERLPIKDEVRPLVLKENAAQLLGL